MSKSAPAFQPRSLAELSPEYATLARKRDELSAQLSALQSEASAIIRKTVDTRHHNGGRSRASAGQSISAEVAELLNEPAVGDSIASDQARLAEIERESGPVQSALGIITERLDRERLKASRLMAAEAAGAHKEIVAALCTALLNVRAAWDRYKELTDALSRENFAWVDWPVMNPRFIGESPQLFSSRLGQYLQRAADAGFINSDLIPPPAKAKTEFAHVSTRAPLRQPDLIDRSGRYTEIALHPMGAN